jgi:hypothetical protein
LALGERDAEAEDDGAEEQLEAVSWKAGEEGKRTWKKRRPRITGCILLIGRGGD